MQNVVFDLQSQVMEMKKYINFKKSVRIRRLLLEKGYYRISRYAKFALKYTSLLKAKPDQLFLFALYSFDSSIRLLFFKYIKNIEIKFRTCISTYMTSKTSNPNFYFDQSVFVPSKGEQNKSSRQKNLNFYPKFHAELISKEKSLRTDVIKYPDLKDYRKNGQYYHEKIACWTFFEYLDLGNIATIFEYLNNSYRKDIIANNYSFSSNVTKGVAKEFDSWIYSIRNLRNKCAHHNRIIGSTMPVIKLGIDDLGKNILVSDSDLFSRIYAIAKFMNIYDRSELKSKIKKLIIKFENCKVKFSALNLLPIDWETRYDLIS